MKRKKTRGASGGFTLIELLVVIVIVLMVLAMAIPIVTAFMKNKGLSNAGSMVKAAATKARSRAIATRDVQYMLIFIGDGTDNPITYQVDPVSDPNAPSRNFTSTRNTIVLVDENARATANNYSDWILKVDEPMVLPKQAEFVRGTPPYAGGSSPKAFAIEVHFYSDGSLILVNQTDQPSINLRNENIGWWDNLLNSGESSNWSGNFDLAVKNKSFTSVCVMDFVSNTGTVDFLVYPK